jgi:hypothetical protein
LTRFATNYSFAFSDFGERAQERLVTEEDLLESVKKYRKCADVGHFSHQFALCRNGIVAPDTDPLD